jgi:hypothetical protein
VVQDRTMPERLSDHCSLMAVPGGPPKPKERPADCPKDGVYIKGANKNGGITIDGPIPYPIIYEGGDGNDSVTIVGGTSDKGIVIDGGKGDDSLTVIDRWSWFVGHLSPGGALALGSLAIVFAAVTIIAWRALTPDKAKTD